MRTNKRRMLQLPTGKFIDRNSNALLEFFIASSQLRMARNLQPVTIDRLREAHARRRPEIRKRLREFREVWQSGSDDRLWEELVYCIFTAGASAKMGLRAVTAVKPLLQDGTQQALTDALTKPPAYRFYNVRAAHVVKTREYLRGSFSMEIRKQLKRIHDPFARRDWLARNPGITGLGYKEASHFLRNVGFCGYGILDKHIVRSLNELGVVDSPKPPTTRRRYLESETRMRDFASKVGIDFDELDLALWSMKTGEVLK
jgi:N-glycosylase/DNA lyase